MLRRWFSQYYTDRVPPAPEVAADTANGSLIELRRVDKSFISPTGSVRVLKAVDLRVGRGEFVAVIGKSGSGKSTLINTITGIDRPTSGEVLVCGTPIHTLRESELAVWRGHHLGVIFQFFQLLPTLTVIENVMLPMELAHHLAPRRRRTRALELLELVGMDAYANRLPTALSGGQQQRVAIARALANEPAVLVADEPTGSLDARTAETVFDLFKHLADQGTTVLMVTHDRDLASRVSRVILLVDGEIMERQLNQALPRLSCRELVHLSAHLESITYPPGAVIVRQGDVADRFYILLKGEVDVVLEQPGAPEQRIDRRTSGEFFGEIGLLQGRRRTATVRATATSETVVLALQPLAFHALLAGSEPTREGIVHAMCLRLLNLEHFSSREPTHD